MKRRQRAAYRSLIGLCFMSLFDGIVRQRVSVASLVARSSCSFIDTGDERPPPSQHHILGRWTFIYEQMLLRSQAKGVFPS